MEFANTKTQQKVIKVAIIASWPWLYRKMATHASVYVKSNYEIPYPELQTT